MSYKEKYLKYKQKYIELKNQIGGVDPDYEMPNDQNTDYTTIVKKLIELISKNPDVFILKLGSNDIESDARCPDGDCYYYIYNDNNELIDDKYYNKDVINTKYLKNIKK